jgi:1,4-dihydroxy-2-naphthoyl-CoA hydrolase
MTLLAVEPAEVTVRIVVRKALAAWNGYLHAGTTVSLADTCCGYGTIRNLPEGASGFTTIELKSNFVGTTRDGVIACTARLLHLGRSTHVWEATVSHAGSERRIAHFRCTQMILWAKPVRDL